MAKKYILYYNNWAYIADNNRRILCMDFDGKKGIARQKYYDKLTKFRFRVFKRVSLRGCTFKKICAVDRYIEKKYLKEN